MTRNFQLMFWDCHRRCEFPSRTRCSQVAVLSLSSPDRVDARQVERPKFDMKEETLFELRCLGLAGRTSLSYVTSMVLGHLRSEGLNIQRERIRKCLAHIDHRNVRIRWAITVSR